MRKNFSGIIIECIKGDIAAQNDIAAVVNAANAQLKTGGGVAGALHSKAGPELAEECGGYAPIKPGEAVISQGYKLPNEYVIHCLGPVYGVDKPEEEHLANCYQNALRLAEEYGINSIAFPAISTGAFGYPLAEATEITFQVIREMLPSLKNLKLIRFVLFDEKTLQVYSQYLRGL